MPSNNMHNNSQGLFTPPTSTAFSTRYDHDQTIDSQRKPGSFQKAQEERYLAERKRYHQEQIFNMTPQELDVYEAKMHAELIALWDESFELCRRVRRKIERSKARRRAAAQRPKVSRAEVQSPTERTTTKRKSIDCTTMSQDRRKKRRL